MYQITVCFGQFLAGVSLNTSNQDRHEKMTRTTPTCATWCTERWICSWHYWFSTSSSTV